MSGIKPLYPGDLKGVTDIIQQISARAVDVTEEFHDQQQRYHILKLLLSLTETISHILNYNLSPWKDLTYLDRRRVASSLLDELQKCAVLLAHSSGRENSFTKTETNILLSVKVLNVSSATPVELPVPDDFHHRTPIDDKLILPTQALAEISAHGLAKVVFIAYNGVEELLNPQPEIQPLSAEGPRNASWHVNSKVIAALGGMSGTMRLSEPAIIIFRHLKEENMTNPICVFWEFDVRQWSGEGCSVHTSNVTYTTCACDHLGDFAVIMEGAETEVSDG